MIEFLEGTVLHCDGETITLNVNGVGYGLKSPGRTNVMVKKGDACQFWVTTYVREDALKLFGFEQRAEKALFETVLSISGVGPKVALSIVDKLTTTDVCQAVVADNAKVFQEVPGVGPKQSKKILLELKGKIEQLMPMGDIHGAAASPAASPEQSQQSQQLVADVCSALSHLGFKEKECRSIAKALVDENPDLEIEAIIKLALVELRNPGIARSSELFPETF